MLDYMEYLNTPVEVAIALAGVLFFMNVAGEILEFEGKVVPEFVKMRKYFARKKRERHALSEMTNLLAEHKEMAETIKEVKKLLADFDHHYSTDNIAMRDNWIKEVNTHIKESEAERTKQNSLIAEVDKKLDKNSADIVSLLIESKRNTIIDFASLVIDENNPVTREQFNRVFKIYDEYEDIIRTNGLTNGEVDIAQRIIKEAYETHMKNHSFIEDVRGYGCELGGI